MMINMLLVLPAQTDVSGFSSILPFLLIAVVFWFFMIRPQMKRQKELRKFREELQKGDKIVTTGGIYGKVVEIQDNAIIIDVESNCRLKIDKAAIIKDMSDVVK